MITILLLLTVFTVIIPRGIIKICEFLGKTGRATPHRPTGTRWCAVALAFCVMGYNSSRGYNYSKYGILLFLKGLYKLKISQISQFFKWDLNLFFLSHKFYLRGGRIRRKQKSVNIVATKRMIMDNGGKANRIIWIYCFCTDSKSICADLSFGNQDRI